MTTTNESESGSESDEVLPFDVELERLPIWVHAASAIVFVVGLLVALRIVPMLAFLPFLILSSLGRRFASSATHLEVRADSAIVGNREIPRSKIRDVWLDEEEPRVVIAFHETDLAILSFKNREQADRCAAALASATRERRQRVVGYLPRPIDALPSLRFLALAIAFFGTGSWLGAPVALLFAVNAYFFASARQVTVEKERLTIRSVLGARTIDDVTQVDVESGVVHLRDGSEIAIAKTSLRDATLASPLWISRARAHALSILK